MINHKGLSTRCVWAGEENRTAGAPTQVPVVHSVAFGYRDVEHWRDVALGRASGHIYGRNTNPTVEALEEKIRLLENAEAATSAASGMAAISSVLFTLLSPGDRVVSVKDTYGGTNVAFREFLARFGIHATLCDTGNHEAVEAEIAKGCKALYLESPTNPTIKVLDIARLAAAGRASGALVLVDNTFATPVNQNPLELGAHLVVHSATKYLSGHADALGGLICGDKELVEQVYHYREINGAALDPMSAYLILRGVKTLSLRVERQNENALKIAQFLESRPEVGQVFYPGLVSDPGHAIAKRQMRGFGGMLSFKLREDSLEAVSRFLPALKLAHMAANLGSVETIAGPPATTSHVECTVEERAAMGVPEGLVRYSVGVEDAQDLMDDLAQALETGAKGKA